MTKGALKGAVFAANIYEKLGFDVVPNSTEPRQDIIQAVTLKSPERLIAFCKGIQAAAPVDSYVDPEPWDMPGYDSQVIICLLYTSVQDNDIIEELKGIDIGNLTPMEALNTLYNLQNKIKNRW